MTDSQDWMYDLVKCLPKFLGLAHEDPYRHLKEFSLVCLSMRPAGVSKETMLIKMFPMSLQDEARDWFIYQYPFNSWQETQQKFFDKFFPAAKVTSIRMKITAIEQFQEESLADYWERFNRLCTTCPNHQFPEHLLLTYFYEGLLDNERILVDAAIGGCWMDMTPTEARKLLCKLTGESPIEVAKEEPEQLVLDSDTDSPEDAADNLEFGKKLLSEQKQVYSEPEIPILPDLPTHSNACDLTHTDSIGFMTDTDTNLIDHSKIFNSVSAIEPISESSVNINFERKTVQSDDFTELGLNFDLAQFSENFECDCESGSCSICAEIDYALQPNSKFITDAINCEFDDKDAELKENAGADIKKLMITEEEYTAMRRKKKHFVADDRAILMTQFLLIFSLLNHVMESISLIVQIWQHPP
ncbi:uncharacterized protein LOC128197582 [Vigna angularis]|uniref:uncharacterized protein LOC128197581 n=1 Tax=Phaseolus angularis TaxID=3914 RepID=UPI0022B44748|nr:uncharacterized protein LOC128197581 [Vigna angularis]XP_052735638.1 uncharacterized protein LOC128197581 [Vigna angularis]XP_052735639.1 uncharacterized protein LOC128197582 [Vigna angularis]XP_052735640.1 uncharacterized protein LOC128197582 [Vigna angularis]